MNTKNILALVIMAMYAVPAISLAETPVKKIQSTTTKIPTSTDPLASPATDKTVTPPKVTLPTTPSPLAAPAAPSSAIEPVKVEYNNPKVGSFSELDELRSQNALLTERLKRADFQNKINGANTTSVPSVGTLTASSNKIKRTKKSKDITDYDARIRLVSGIGTNLSATIVFSDGSKSIARVGSRIDGLGTVKSINTDEVIVTSGKESYAIPFEAEPVNNTPTGGLSASSFPTQAPVMPQQ